MDGKERLQTLRLKQPDHHSSDYTAAVRTTSLPRPALRNSTRSTPACEVDPEELLALTTSLRFSVAATLTHTQEKPTVTSQVSLSVLQNGKMVGNPHALITVKQIKLRTLQISSVGPTGKKVSNE